MGEGLGENEGEAAGAMSLWARRRGTPVRCLCCHGPPPDQGFGISGRREGGARLAHPLPCIPHDADAAEGTAAASCLRLLGKLRRLLGDCKGTCTQQCAKRCVPSFAARKGGRVSCPPAPGLATHRWLSRSPFIAPRNSQLAKAHSHSLSRLHVVHLLWCGVSGDVSPALQGISPS